MSTTEQQPSQALAIREKTNKAIATLNDPRFLEQIEQSLPENVPARRFVRIAATAIRSNPDLVGADQTTLFAAIVKCAQDGLYPDGREAALPVYKGKVGYIPMIGGFRKIAAEFGWTLRTRVVYASDEFDYTEEPPTLRHTPSRPGVDRGDLVATYAIATHADGRRLQRVLHPEDVKKRAAIAQTDRIWKQWPAAMWEKTAVRDLFAEIPFGEADRRVASVLDASRLEPGEAAALLYGRRDDGTPAIPPPEVSGPGSPTDATQTDDSGQGPDGSAGRGGDGSSSFDGSASVPEPDFSDEPTGGDVGDEEVAGFDEDEVNAAAAVQVGGGVNKGLTLEQVAAKGTDGETWLLWALKRWADDAFRAAVTLYVQARVDGVWARYQEWLAEPEQAA